MKRYLFMALFATFFISCSDDDKVDPDLTKDFVGNWKGEVKKEVGYEYSSDWLISRVDDKTVKIVSTYKLVSTDPKIPSSTEVSNINDVIISKANDNTLTMTTTQEIAIPGDTILVKGTGVVSGRSLTVTSTGTSKKTGVVTKPPVQRFTKE
ncbi:hypothetical protein [Dyadobacter sp. 676]|uniref:Lipocalin-like domain-containing protein n=1 Tax=Dyadobacter sp. 676 TaxID=3088362 RepID=A0AAU8FQ28_9BACT